MINDLRIIENIEIIFNHRVILYGAGEKGTETQKMLRDADIGLLCFCDGDHRKWGKEIGGVAIKSPAELKHIDESESIAIIIATEQVFLIEQMIHDIERLHLRTEEIFTCFGLKISLIQNINHKSISEKYRISLFCEMKLERMIRLAEGNFSQLFSVNEDYHPVLVYQPA